MPLKTVKFSESVENVEKFEKLDDPPEEEELVPVKPIFKPEGSPEVKKTVPGSMLQAVSDEKEEDIPVRQSPKKAPKVESVKKQPSSKLEKQKSVPKLDETMKTP